jgi:uncharacterized protein (DUF2336 family)
MKGIMSRMMEKARLVAVAPAYEEARDLANDPDSNIRRKLAARQDTRPEILYYLAEDVSPDVRCEIAANAATPAPAHLILARDKDSKVRCELSRKIGKLLPHLPPDAHSKLRDVTIEVLEILARDQLERVRQILAETLNNTANVPPHVIRWLARDVEISVAAPILQFSPLLTDNDLAEIIETAPIQGALIAISRRAGLSASLSDAIVTTDDRQAIAELLGNSTAQLREETLDYVVERSREVTTWQEPLVRRLRLPRSIVRKLADFVADSLLSVLRQRSDLPPDVLEEVAAVVRQRLAKDDEPREVATDSVGQGKDAMADGAPDPGGMSSKGAALVKYVQQLHAEGRLDEDAIDEALMQGNSEFATLSLALLSGLAPAVISRMVAAQSAKGITALAWKAGLGMRFGIKLQTRLARIAPSDVLNAKNGSDYPLTPKEMDWMINFFSE